MKILIAMIVWVPILCEAGSVQRVRGTITRFDAQYFYLKTSSEVLRINRHRLSKALESQLEHETRPQEFVLPIQAIETN